MADIYPWQQALWSQLGGRAQHAHAYLLYGPAGIGKRALAEHWAAQLLCQRPAAAGACGECKACQLLAAGTHPDYFVLEPEEAEKPIRVDQVRDLVGFVVQTAQLGGRKVVLLEPAEAMNVNAANALLKSLEEPSGDTVLLLISHQPAACCRPSRAAACSRPALCRARRRVWNGWRGPCPTSRPRPWRNCWRFPAARRSPPSACTARACASSARRWSRG